MKQYLECYVCHSKEQRLLLHNICLQAGEYQKLCTSCVLKHHTGLFCSHCFEIYKEGFNPPADCITCLKCDSLSHLGCVSKDVVTRYLCPSCLNPAYVYFDVVVVGGGGGGLNNKNKNTNTSNSSTQDGECSSSKKVIDIKLSKILLTAAQFASVSMKDGVTAERIKAEKRVKEACEVRKRALHCLETQVKW